MKKVHKISKMVALTLVLAIMVSFIPAGSASASTVYYIKYIDRNFYGRSAPEPFYLQLDYDTLYMSVCSEGDVSDQVTLHIILAETNTCVYEHIFTADGHIEKLSFAVPTGRYKIYFSGDPDIKKTQGMVVWGRHDPVVQFVWPW